MKYIKLRAWHYDRKEFVPIDDDDFYVESNGILIAPAKFIVTVFTGLKDKNGKDIYQGDIVKTKWQRKAEMLWVDKEACFGLRTIDEIIKDEIMYGFDYGDMEVIGNIYENPDLLDLNQSL